MKSQFDNLLKLFLLGVAFFFAPIWIPVGFIVVVPAILAVAGILTTIAIICTGFLTCILGIFGIPFLFSAATTAVVYIMMKVFGKISGKILGNIKGFIPKLKSYKLKQLWWLPSIKLFASSASNQNNDESSLSDNEKPLYEEESEVETVVCHSEPPKMHFPSPKASFSLLDVQESREDVEIFFDHVDQLYTVICSLRKTARERARKRIASRRNQGRRNTIA